MEARCRPHRDGARSPRRVRKAHSSATSRRSSARFPRRGTPKPVPKRFLGRPVLWRCHRPRPLPTRSRMAERSACVRRRPSTEQADRLVQRCTPRPARAATSAAGATSQTHPRVQRHVGMVCTNSGVVSAKHGAIPTGSGRALRPILKRFRPSLSPADQNQDGFDPSWSGFDQSRRGFGQCWVCPIKFGASSTKVEPVRPNLVRLRPNALRVCPNLGRSATKSG